MAGATGLEPAASAVTGQGSNQMSYAPPGGCSSYKRPKAEARETPSHLRKLRKSLIYLEESMVRVPPNRLCGHVFGVSPNRRIQEEGPTDGNGSWKSSDTTDRHAEASRCGTRGNPRDVEETGGDRARGSRRQYCQASEERRAHPHRRSRHPSGP